MKSQVAPSQVASRSLEERIRLKERLSSERLVDELDHPARDGQDLLVRRCEHAAEEVDAAATKEVVVSQLRVAEGIVTLRKESERAGAARDVAEVLHLEESADPISVFNMTLTVAQRARERRVANE